MAFINKVNSIEYLKPLIRGKHDTPPTKSNYVLCTADGLYYSIYTHCSKKERLQQLGLNYPIKISQVYTTTNIEAKQVRLKAKYEFNIQNHVSVSICSDGTLKLNNFCLSNDFFEPSKAQVLIYSGNILFQGEPGGDYFSVDEHSEDYHVTNKASDKLLRRWYGTPITDAPLAENYLHKDDLHLLRKKNPPEYFNFTKDLQYVPEIIESYFTKEELIKYDQLCRDGYRPMSNSSTDYVYLNGVVFLLEDWPADLGIVKEYIREKKPLVTCCNVVLSYQHLNWSDIREIKQRLSGSQHLTQHHTQHPGYLTIEKLLMIKEEYVHHFLGRLSVYERMEFLKNLSELNRTSHRTDDEEGWSMS